MESVLKLLPVFALEEGTTDARVIAFMCLVTVTIPVEFQVPFFAIPPTPTLTTGFVRNLSRLTTLSEWITFALAEHVDHRTQKIIGFFLQKAAGFDFG